MSEFSKKFKKRIAVTGGAGFIGSNLLLMMVPRYPDYLFVNVDSLTYAGNLSNLSAIASEENYRFEKIDICNYESLASCFEKYEINAVIHLAAESHVDRSIIGPAQFISTNVTGTFNLLELARLLKESGNEFRFHHVSTDEVYGSIDGNQKAIEDSPFRPNSPYAATKAAADHLVRSYHKTYGLDTVTTNCSNNYGPYQFPEKLIPLVINNAIKGIRIPVYGDGQQVRDWLYVEDHCEALDLTFHNAETGKVYNISGDNELPNIDLIRRVCQILNAEHRDGEYEQLIEFVSDRPGHDRRYALDASRIRNDLGWNPKHSIDEGLNASVRWYLDNKSWLDQCVSGEYQKYYDTVYSRR